MIIRARCLLPLAEGPVDNGAVVLEEGRVKWLGRWPECDPNPGETRVDLGEVVLLPGLINAHCHLDYTNMAGQIPPPKTFPDWVKTILSFKAHWSFSEFAESWLKGARMLLEHGTTTVADIESVPELPSETWKSTPLRMVSFLEMTNVKSRRPADEILDEALDWFNQWPKDEKKEAALSPHALYSTTPELMKRTAAVAKEQDLLLSVHLAESEAEYQMFTDARGPFHDWLKAQRKMEDCGHASPVRLAEQYGLLTDRTLVIHANYLAPGDADLVARGGASVVHCPRSHDYFGHARFPYETLVKAGANVCLATDSLASSRKVGTQNPELDLWSEMRLFARNYPSVAPREILSMATVNAARALRRSNELGVLKTGAWADFAAVAYAGRVQEARICEEILYNGTVREVFVAGENAKNSN